MKSRSKYPSVQSLIGNALLAAAEKAGVSIEELEEIAVPSYGLDEDGTRREQLGEYVAQITVAGSDEVELRWQRQDGKLQASVPKAVKEQHGEDLKELKQVVAELKNMLPAHRERIESLYLQRRGRGPLRSGGNIILISRLSAGWHDASSGHSRQGEVTAGIWWQGEIVGATGQPLAELDDETVVALWHPIGEAPETVLEWRTWLTEHEVTQPFKQAHREVYLLTAAERETHTYSNRFAAHVLKQHQFAALCQQRGWKFHLMGQWDSHNTPTKVLPAWDLRCEYWTGDGMDASEVSGAGIFLYVPTDQVRFYPTALPDPLPLDEIPPLVFSEIMRDVDLFVGVASVGNDPNWRDSGEGR